jgi:hypothetical protein
MLTDADRAAMAADLAEIAADNNTSIVIRRKNVTLAAQDVRIARAGKSQGTQATSGGAVQSEGNITVLGGVDLDIARGDRFNDAAGVLYEVDNVLPNRRHAIMARARMVQ